MSFYLCPQPPSPQLLDKFVNNPFRELLFTKLLCLNNRTFLRLEMEGLVHSKTDPQEGRNI